MHISVPNGAFWNTEQVHSGIYEIGLFSYTFVYLWTALVYQRCFRQAIVVDCFAYWNSPSKPKLIHYQSNKDSITIDSNYFVFILENDTKMLSISQQQKLSLILRTTVAARWMVKKMIKYKHFRFSVGICAISYDISAFYWRELIKIKQTGIYFVCQFYRLLSPLLQWFHIPH